MSRSVRVDGKRDKKGYPYVSTNYHRCRSICVSATEDGYPKSNGIAVDHRSGNLSVKPVPVHEGSMKGTDVPDDYRLQSF